MATSADITHYVLKQFGGHELNSSVGWQVFDPITTDGCSGSREDWMVADRQRLIPSNTSYPVYRNYVARLNAASLNISPVCTGDEEVRLVSLTDIKISNPNPWASTFIQLQSSLMLESRAQAEWLGDVIFQMEQSGFIDSDSLSTVLDYIRYNTNGFLAIMSIVVYALPGSEEWSGDAEYVLQQLKQEAKYPKISNPADQKAVNQMAGLLYTATQIWDDPSFQSKLEEVKLQM